jgi:DNA-binding MarR family transcriptional regulator
MSSSETTHTLLAIFNRLIYLERRHSFLFEGIRLYPSEIHLMLETGGDQAINATRIAERMGITKGAISQTLVRLEKKGILRKVKDPNNKNELSILLTPTGKRAYEEYCKMTDKLFSHLDTLMLDYSIEEQEVIGTFLSDLEKILKKI